MAYPLEKRHEVRRYYVYDRFPMESAAEKAGIPYNTARIWKQKAKEEGDDWERARSAAMMAGGNLGDLTNQVVEQFSTLFKSVIDDINTGDYDGLKKAEAISRLSDAYTKTMKAAAGGNPQIARLSVALEVLKAMADFIREHYEADLPRFTVILEAFAVRVNEVFA